jgi:hypothetical protein
LRGREPATGIELSLSIPCSEIEDVGTSNGSSDLLVGGPSVVVSLAGSQPVLLREIDPSAQQTAQLAERLKRALRRS